MTDADLAPLYRRIDELLELRARDFPRRVEPTFGDLQAAIRGLGASLRERAGDVAAEEPPEALVSAPVFVLGYYRSGTTLMLSLLEGHPDVVALPSESRHFTVLRHRPLDEVHDAWIRRLVSPDGQPPFWTLGRPWEDGDDGYERFTRRLFAYAAARPADDLLGIVAAALAGARGRPARVWAEKTPRNELLVDDMLAVYPDARFVHVVRDPRATVASIHAWNRSQFLVSVPAAAVELRDSLSAARENAERLGEERYLVVRYEDLVADPEAQMRRVAWLLELPWSDALVEPSTTANSSSPERRVQGRIHDLSARAGADLDARTDAVVRAFTAAPATALGYEMRAGSRPVALGVRAYLSVTFRAKRALARARASVPRRSRSM